MGKKYLNVIGFWLCPCCARIHYHVEGSNVNPDTIIYECGTCDFEMEYHHNFTVKDHA